MTFEHTIDSTIKRENKRTRLPGTIVQDVKRIVTATEIGKATIQSVDTPMCDGAQQATEEDMKNPNPNKEK